MEKNKDVKKPILLIIGAILLVVVTVIIVVAIMSGGKNGDNNSNDGNINSDVLDRGFVEEDNAQTIVSDMKEKVEEGMFECSMSTKWTFADGKSESTNAYVGNSENNTHTFYFDVYIEDTEEIVYSSPLVPVGYSVTNIKLDKELPAGEYKMVVQYTLVDENYEPISTVGFKVKVKILR